MLSLQRSLASPARQRRVDGLAIIAHWSTRQLPLLYPPRRLSWTWEFDGKNPDDLYRGGLRARVKRVISGNYDGDFVLIRRPAASSCDHPFDNGSSGLVVGFLTKEETLFPVLVQEQYGFQLRADDLVLAP